MTSKTKRQIEKESLRERFMNGNWSVPFKVPNKKELSVTGASQVPIESLDVNSSQDQIRSRDTSSSLVQNRSPDEFKSSGEKQSRDGNQSLDRNVSQDDFAPRDVVPAVQKIQRSSQARRATGQDEAVVEANRYGANLVNGYTRLPNSILLEIVKGELSRNEIKILLLVARMTISFNRVWAALSKSVIEKFSGVQGRAILEAVQSLEKRKLIQKRAGGPHTPNMLALVFDSDIFRPGDKGTQGLIRSQDGNISQVPIEPRDVNASQDRIESLDEFDATSPGENPPHYKDINKNIKLSPSPSRIPEGLRKYFSDLKPLKKRESEIFAFEELLGDYSAEDILACFEIVRSKGVGGEVCHSPMAYLSKAIGGILREVETGRKKMLRRSELQSREAEAAKIQAEEDVRAEAEWSQKWAAFLRNFPNETARTEKLQELLMGTSFGSSSQLGVRLAVGRWAQKIEARHNSTSNGCVTLEKPTSLI